MEKGGGHGQNWTEKSKSSTMNFFDANKVPAHIDSTQDCDGIHA